MEKEYQRRSDKRVSKRLCETKLKPLSQTTITKAEAGGPLGLTTIATLATKMNLRLEDVIPLSSRCINVAIIATFSKAQGSSDYIGPVIAKSIDMKFAHWPNPPDYLIHLFDDCGSPARASELVERCWQDYIHVIIGCVDSATAFAAAKRARELRIPIITPAATASYLTHDSNPWFFQALESDERRTQRLADWAGRERNNLLIVHETRSVDEINRGDPELYGESAAKDICKQFKPSKYLTPLSFERSTYKGDEFVKNLNERLEEADGVVLLALNRTALHVARVIRESVPTMPIYLLSDNEQMFSTLRSQVYVITATKYQTVKDDELSDFVDEYSKFTSKLLIDGTEESVESNLQQAEWNNPVAQYGGYGADAAQIVLSAIDLAEMTIPEIVEGSPAREKLRDLISRTPNDHRRLMSSGSFNDSGTIATMKSARMALIDGNWEHRG
jgi:hypothetical protein